MCIFYVYLFVIYILIVVKIETIVTQTLYTCSTYTKKNYALCWSVSWTAMQGLPSMLTYVYIYLYTRKPHKPSISCHYFLQRCRACIRVQSQRGP